MLFSGLFKKPTYELCVAHYYRGKDEHGRVKPFHRAITIVTDGASQPARGTVFQVAQSSGKLGRLYQLSDADVTLSQIPERYSGRVKIGEVKGAGEIRLIEHILTSVPVDQALEEQWTGQNWARDGVRKLATAGFVDRAAIARMNDQLARMETEYILTLSEQPQA